MSRAERAGSSAPLESLSATGRPSSTPILSVRDLYKSFTARRDVVDLIRRRHPTLVAVDGVSFELRAHQAIGIVGESGSGKSTVAKCLVRLHEPDAGTITYRDAD